MSERNELHIFMVGAALMICSTVCLVSLLSGRDRGRAEMKLWQDSYYAAHPVVKEVRPSIDKAGMEAAYAAGVNWGVNTILEEFRKQLAAPPAPPAKVSKPRPVKPNVVYCGDRPCSEFSAKPAPCITPSNGPQDVKPPSYLEVNDCSWHHGRNPREAPRP